MNKNKRIFIISFICGMLGTFAAGRGFLRLADS